MDRSVLGPRDPLRVAEAAIRGGADCIQWRDKTSGDLRFLEVARDLRRLTRRLGSLFVVNDRLDVALLAGADAVHLGQEDLPIREARRLGAGRLLIGRSTHSLAQALAAERERADYIGVGPVFSTPTKPDYPAVGLRLIRQVRDRVRIPWFAIGGIDLQTAALVLSAGASRVAAVRAVAGRPDPEKAAGSLKGLLG